MIKENEIYLGDNLIYTKQIPDKYIDLVLTDIPYGINMDGGKLGKGKEFIKKEWDKVIPDKIYFNEMKRISKHCIIWEGNYCLEHLENTRCMIIWYKHQDGLNRTFANCEIAWTDFDLNSKVYHIIWDGFQKEGSDNKKVHPTQKSLKLFVQILQDFSKENDLIFDGFAGSGTTALACIELNRRFICVEKDKDYFSIAQTRINNAKSQLRLF